MKLKTVMILGFSTCSLYQTHDPLSAETFDVFRKIGANAIEIMVHSMDDAPRLLNLEQKDLAGFRWVSVHAPSFDRFDTNSVIKFRQTLEILEQFCQKIKVNSIVFHPDQIGEWAIFENYTFPVLIENMDWRKEVGKYTDSMKEIFEKADAPMVFDLNHCYTNDPTMHLAEEMVENFRDRIFEIHLSGFEKFHEPLFQTQQIEILNAIYNKEMPIIIESVCNTVEDAKQEFEYVKKHLLS